jgi:MerR family transcriptional regulator/heat shock protein HspR
MTARRDAAEQRDGLVGYYHIEIVSEQIGLTPARIRHYERSGLVGPARVQGRARFYGEADVARLRRLRRLTHDLGLNPAGVEIVTRLLDELESLRAEVRAMRNVHH